MFHSFNSFIQQCNTHFYSHRTIETHSNVINPSTRFFFLFSNPHYWRNRYGNKAKCYQLTTYFLVVVGVNSLVLNYLFLILHDSFFFFFLHYQIANRQSKVAKHYPFRMPFSTDMYMTNCKVKLDEMLGGQMSPASSPL